MIIEIVNATRAEENGLGALYRIEQRRDGQPWVHLIARVAVATDMELFGIGDPARVVEWHLHEALAPPTTDPSPADQLAFEAQQLTAAMLTTRARLAAGLAAAGELAADLNAAQDTADGMRDQARDMKTAEISQLKDIVTVADDQGFADLCALVTSDESALAADRATYREHITNRITI
ncbi:hypothetical protein [Actinophytocola sediminis]